MSEFRGNDLFGSGPHRFIAGERALVVIPLWVASGVGFDDGEGSVALGNREVTVTVQGVLVASSESALRTLREDVEAETVYGVGPLRGTLEDNHGREWAGMSLVRYQETGAVRRGRRWSVGYEALFRQITS
ncbi:MAG: hypothetical protein AAF995_01735 [Planctomycetota bacterium]